MATHSNILAWKMPGKRSLEGHSLKGHKESDMTKHTWGWISLDGNKGDMIL